MEHHKKDILYIGGFIVILFILWVMIGGPQKAKQSGDAYRTFQKPLEPLDSGATYNASSAPSGNPNATY